MSSISLTERWPQIFMYSSRVIFPSATSSSKSTGFIDASTPTQPVKRRFAMSSPAIFEIFLRVPKRGTSDIPLSVRIDASPSLSFGINTSSQYFMSEALSSIFLISAISSSDISSKRSTISCFSFLESFDLFFGKRRFQRLRLKAFLSNGDMGISTPEGIPPTRSFTVS